MERQGERRDGMQGEPRLVLSIQGVREYVEKQANRGEGFLLLGPQFRILLLSGDLETNGTARWQAFFFLFYKKSGKKEWRENQIIRNGRPPP